MCVGLLRRATQAGVRANLGEQEHAVAHRLTRVGDRRQRVIFHLDKLRSVDAAGASLAQHHRDDLANEANALGG
jgi:hypothetical protein